MKKNSTLQQKLKSYSAMAGAVATTTAIATDSNAQIVYTDITDVTVSTAGSGYNLDLDNGGTVDFVLAYNTYTSSGVVYDYVFAYSAAPTTNQIDSVSGGFATVHNSMDPINASNLWHQGLGSTSPVHILSLRIDATGIGYGVYNYGSWMGATDKYLAVKFDLSGTNHYGWARLSVAADSKSFTIKDYAYQSTANTAINAGDMGSTSGIANNKLEGIKVFSNGKQINVGLGELAAANVVVRDMTGREVYTSVLNNNFSQITLDDAAQGIYTVSVSTNDGHIATSKVVLK